MEKRKYAKRENKYSREDLLEIIKTGFSEGKTQMKEYEARASIRKEFGSWNEALQIAGIEPLRRRKGYSREELIEALISEYKKNNNTISYADSQLASSVVREFGSWNKGLNVAGIDLNRTLKEKRYNISKKELIKAYIQLSRDLDKEEYGASKRDINKAFKNGGFPCAESSLVARFSSLNNLKRESRFKEWNKEVTYTKEELTKLLKEKMKKLGRNLTTTEINKDVDLPSLPVFYSRFGTFHLNEIYKYINKNEESSNEFSEMEEMRSKNGLIMYSKNQITASYIKLSEKLGKTEYGATSNDIQDSFKEGDFLVHRTTVFKYMGNMNTLRKQAGFKEKIYRPYTKNELIDHLNSLIDSNKAIVLANFGHKGREEIIEIYGSWLNFLKENGINKAGNIVEKLQLILDYSKYKIVTKEHCIYNTNINKIVKPDTSGGTPMYVFRIKKKVIKINKYAFWAYIHNIIDETFDTKHQKIVFKNGKEKYTKDNVEITFKSDCKKRFEKLKK